MLTSFILEQLTTIKDSSPQKTIETDNSSQQSLRTRSVSVGGRNELSHLLASPRTSRNNRFLFKMNSQGNINSNNNNNNNNNIELESTEIFETKRLVSILSEDAVYGSTVVDIFIPPPSFKPVSLSFSRSLLKHPNKSFLTQSLYLTSYILLHLYYCFYKILFSFNVNII